ncbi:MAG TPA: GDSL-type esterase/lipase family protein [Jiangellaceae bacterium]|nr:GDSL-type esterase/lipase family protein [Jiangellaceae bacterium]
MDLRRGVLASAAAVLMLGGGLAAANPAAAESRPTAVVSLGDSAASGEGARNYEPGTNQSGNFCHRSLDSYIHETAIPGIDATINLACSGARSTHLQIGGQSRYGENQAAMLADAAAQYDVKLVTVQIGANDDPGFGETVLECVIRWAAIVGPGCRDTIGAEWPDRVEAMKPKVADAVNDVRKVMSDAGYAESDYELVLVSYASPVTENMRLLTHALEGCPIRLADAKWGRTVATVLLNDALRSVARDLGVRFLDLSRATEGREACNRSVSTHWIRPLTVAVQDVVNGIGGNLVQESFHPNARGHSQMGGCVREFYAGDATQAACRRGSDGNLHAVASG